MTPEQIEALVNAILSGIMGTTGGADGTTIAKDAIKLTEAGAKQLLDVIMTDIQFTGKLSKEDLSDFVQKYNKEANRQLETVVQTVRSQTKPGDTPEDIKNIIKTTSPSFFQPKDFATDYLWAKVNFADEKTLGAKALDALIEARKVARDFNLSTVSDIEIREAAKKIASGKMTKDDYITELGRLAVAEYPQYAERFKNTPGATTRSLNNPILKVIAEEWEVEADSLDLNDPFIDGLIRPDGTIGKASPATIAEARMKAAMHPNADKSTKYVTAAQTAGNQLARAMGYGI